MSNPAISVILPVFNGEKFLHEALHSLVAQTFEDFEIIAVNDGSSDRSGEILADFATRDSRLRIISRQNTGIVRALEDARTAARGEFLARMDADDWAAPERFENQLAAMRAEPRLVALGSSVTFMDTSGNPVEICQRSTDHAAIRSALLDGDGGALIHPAVMFRSEAVADVGGYRRAAQYMEDLDLYLRLDAIGRLGNLPQQLLRYRVHPASINFTKNGHREAVKLAVLKEAYAARGLRFDASRFVHGPSAFADLSRLHRTWAVTALECGPRYVAVRHGWRAVQLAPCEPAAWRALRYALTAPRVS